MKQSKLKTILILASSLFVITLQSCSKESDGENESKISSHGANDSHNMGQNCMGCHSQGGSGSGWFVVAGTVYNSAKTITYPNATVKLYTGANGTGTLKYTIQGDAKGNFYTTENIDFGSGLYPSVQGSTGTQNMSTAITMGQCNSCHGVSTDKIWTN
ncbi:MAG TPA: hypothetical protein VGK38_05505 [Prolixibacteraceae bacterium]|jgi:hypothetical protein